MFLTPNILKEALGIHAEVDIFRMFEASTSKEITLK